MTEKEKDKNTEWSVEKEEEKDLLSKITNKSYEDGIFFDEKQLYKVAEDILRVIREKKK
jgi:hypothetical protein